MEARALKDSALVQQISFGKFNGICFSGPANEVFGIWYSNFWVHQKSYFFRQLFSWGFLKLFDIELFYLYSTF